MHINRPLYWTSSVALALFLLAATFLICFAYNIPLSSLLACADDASRPSMQWLCKKDIYLMRLAPEDVAELNTMAGASRALQLKDPQEAANMLAHFLSYGVDIDSKDSQTGGAGNTALHKAVFANRADQVELLLAHGARTDVVNAQYQTPLVLAKDLQQRHPQEDRGKVIKLLVEAKQPKYSGFVRRGE